jgi:hypothetical protein
LKYAFGDVVPPPARCYERIVLRNNKMEDNGGKVGVRERDG